MASVKRSSVELTTTNATQVGQAGSSGGAFNIFITNLSGGSVTVTVAINASTATIADVGTIMKTFSVPTSGEPTIIKGVDFYKLWNTDSLEEDEINIIWKF